MLINSLLYRIGFNGRYKVGLDRAGGLDLNDPEFIHRRYHNDSAYRQSKQANRMLTLALPKNLRRFKLL